MKKLKPASYFFLGITFLLFISTLGSPWWTIVAYLLWVVSACCAYRTDDSKMYAKVIAYIGSIALALRSLNPIQDTITFYSIELTQHGAIILIVVAFILPAIVFEERDGRREKTLREMEEKQKHISSSYREFLKNECKKALDFLERGSPSLHGNRRATIYAKSEKSSCFETLARHSNDRNLAKTNRGSIPIDGVVKSLDDSKIVKSFQTPTNFWEQIKILASDLKQKEAFELQNPSFPKIHDLLHLKDSRMKTSFYCGSVVLYNGQSVGLMIYEAAEMPEVNARQKIEEKMRKHIGRLHQSNFPDMFSFWDKI